MSQQVAEAASQHKIDLSKIDTYRKSYEINHHWVLRREFIQLYADKYNADRVICLSNVFVNVECMGLKYPEEVMKLVKELGPKVKGLDAYRFQVSADEEDRKRKIPQNRWQNR